MDNKRWDLVVQKVWLFGMLFAIELFVFITVQVVKTLGGW